jgi:tRNA-uridine aminocarboxypropyltransferase
MRARTMPEAGHRQTCLRCRRPVASCYCAYLVPTASPTRVVFLQHPRERRVAIGTARMAHLALPNSELHVGVDFDDHPRIRALAAKPDGRTVVLFPAAEAVAPEALPAGPPRTLLVVDGTWIQARKMLARNAALRAFPRIGFVPSRPGNYRIRREPAPHCLSTIEAVVEVLGRFERDPARYRPLLRAFERMVDAQIPYKEARRNPYRRTRKRRHQARPDPLRELLRRRAPDLVAVYAEANVYARGSDVPGAPDLVQLVAERVVTGERFAALIAPRRPLAASTPVHLEIAAAALREGETVGAAMARWQAFLRARDVLCVWGSYALDLLRAEGDPTRPALDLRAATTRLLGRKTGGVEAAARLLGVEAAAQPPGAGTAAPRLVAETDAPPSRSAARAATEDAPAPWTAGRAGRRIVALAEVVRCVASDPGDADAAARPAAAPARPRVDAGGDGALP